MVVQPIVELATGRRFGVESLSRFPTDRERPTDVCFAEAHSVGEGDRVELLAPRRGAEQLDRACGYVALNVSPGTPLAPERTALLDDLGPHLDRILLEPSDHDPVDGYDALRDVLAPLRTGGMRLAIDDVGAGFSSLRHIVLIAPDVIKLDRTII
ncbi:MAG: EAL domain-containing protein, partial [Trebonia sp.]